MQPAVFHARLVLPLWAEYGDGPPKSGDYNIKARSKDGREKMITAWHNPGNGHWLADGEECGYVDIITPPGETGEWQITHWQTQMVWDGGRWTPKQLETSPPFPAPT